LAPTMGIAMTKFYHPDEIPNFFIIDISDRAYIAATISYFRCNMKINKKGTIP
jgi:hypothetical protein